MKRSIALAGLMVLAAASSAAAQGRPAQPAQGGAVTTSACPAGAYSVVQSPDGSSVSILFHDFVAEAQAGPARTVRTTCRISVPMALGAGFGADLLSVDYRGFADLGPRQSAELAVDYEVGLGNRGPRFQRRLQGRYASDFTFTDRLPPGRMRRAGCGLAPTLGIDATLTLSTGGQQRAAMIALDTADQAARSGALTYRFAVRPCPPRGLDRPSQIDSLTSE